MNTWRVFCWVGAALVAGPSVAGWAQGVVPPVRAETLAPPPGMARPVAATPTALASPTVTAHAGPFVQKGLVAVVSDSVGFARDEALAKAARQGLGQVLASLGVPSATAAPQLKALGDPMKFVARYSIVAEKLVPVYTLTVDLTFNEALVRSNFGGVLKPVVVTQTVPGMGVSPSAGVGGAVAGGPSQTWRVVAEGRDLRSLERLRANLAQLGANVTYAEIGVTQGGAGRVVWQVVGPVGLEQVLQVAQGQGWQGAMNPATGMIGLSPVAGQ